MWTPRCPGMRGGATVLVLVLSIGGISGCGNGGPEKKLPHDAKRSLDLYLGDKLGLIKFAMLKVRNRCLADAGYPQNLNGMADRPSNPFLSLVIRPGSFGPSTEEEARRRGFGSDRPSQPARIVSFDLNYDKSLERCETRAWEKVGEEAQATYHGYFQFGNDLLGPTSDVHRKFDAELVPKLLDCMEAKGYRVADRQAYLKAPDLAHWGVKLGTLEGGQDDWKPERTPGTVQVGPPIPAKRYVPTPEESEMAVAMFHCNRQVGRFDRQMAEAERVQAELVTKHESTFAELNPKIEALARTAATLAETG